MPEPSEPVVYPGPVSEITEMREDLKNLTGAVHQLINLQLQQQQTTQSTDPLVEEPSKRKPGRPKGSKTTKKTKARRKKTSRKRGSNGADK